MVSDKIKTQSVEVPAIGFGTYRLTGSEGIKAIEKALQTGYRHVDTAQVYDNEVEVGTAIQNSSINRSEIFITTKVFPPNFTRLIKAVEESLKKLKTDHVDLLLLHWPSDDETNKLGIDYLNEAIKKGYTKSIGVSNFNLDQLFKAVAQAPVICNQVEYHPYISQQRMLTYLRKQSMFLMAYSPLAKGKVFKDVILQELAVKYKRSTSQVVLRWLIQQENIAVIPKASSSERIKENLNIFDFALSDEDMKLIFNLSDDHRITNPAWAPKWD